MTTGPIPGMFLNGGFPVVSWNRIEKVEAITIENLGILQDGYDCVDLSDNSIIILGNFPEMKARD